MSDPRLEVVTDHSWIDDEDGVSSEETSDQTSALSERWIRFGDDPNLLIHEPPRQRWLLVQAHRGRSVGVFPRGRSGLLTATGGVGKTYALIDLAVAQALGGFWFGTFKCAEPGHVLLGLAEEDLDEARRRFWKVCNSRELSSDERRTIASRIDLLPLAGVPAALTCSLAPGTITPTPFYSELVERLENRGVDWSLIILDPLSRWAGGGVEGDNESATRFCQVVESLSRAPGNPSVLVAHHSSKTSAKDGAADARGVTGIRDGFRWQASLDPIDNDSGLQGAKMTNRKSNYSRKFDPVVLVRNDEPGTEGTLRSATLGEADMLNNGAKRVEANEYRERVLATVKNHPGLSSASKIAERTTGTKSEILRTVKVLLGEGLLTKDEAGFSIGSAQGGHEP